MNEMEKQEILQGIDVESIVESLKRILLDSLNAINDIIPILKRHLENGALDEVAKRVIIEKIIEEIEKEENE